MINLLVSVICILYAVYFAVQYRKREHHRSSDLIVSVMFSLLTLWALAEGMLSAFPSLTFMSKFGGIVVSFIGLYGFQKLTKIK